MIFHCTSWHSGTHWVCYYNNYYFEPFGLSPPVEVIRYIKDIQYNDIQYQDTKSVLFGYYCLYLLKRLNDGNKIYDILYEDLDYKSPIKNKSMITQCASCGVKKARFIKKWLQFNLIFHDRIIIS